MMPSKALLLCLATFIALHSTTATELTLQNTTNTTNTTNATKPTDTTDDLDWLLVDSTNSSVLPDQPNLDKSLVFVLLGDWGKGGMGGVYGSAIVEDNEGGEYGEGWDEDDDHKKKRKWNLRLQKEAEEAAAEEEGKEEADDEVNMMKDAHDSERRGRQDEGGKNNDKNNDKKDDKKDNKKDDHKHHNHNKNLNQISVARALGNFSATHDPKPSFVVALGDNFYSNGVASASDALWDKLWKDVYLKNFSDLYIPWYPVYGNHDYGYGAKGVQAQIDRYRNHSDDDIWILPSTNHSKRFDMPDGGYVQMVFVDTTTLAPSQNSCCNSDSGISNATQAARIKNQLANIEKMLIEATESQPPPSWLLVSGHYPIYTRGEHSDMSELISTLQPLLEQYKVDMYFCGHDHISEHLQHTNNSHTIQYFVAGAGSMTDSLGNVNSSADLLWAGTGYSAFAYATATSTSLTISFVDTNNTERYNYSLHKDPFPTETPTTIPTALTSETPTTIPTAIPIETPTVPSFTPTTSIPTETPSGSLRSFAETTGPSMIPTETPTDCLVTNNTHPNNHNVPFLLSEANKPYRGLEICLLLLLVFVFQALLYRIYMRDTEAAKVNEAQARAEQLLYQPEPELDSIYRPSPSTNRHSGELESIAGSGDPSIFSQRGPGAVRQWTFGGWDHDTDGVDLPPWLDPSEGHGGVGEEEEEEEEADDEEEGGEEGGGVYARRRGEGMLFRPYHRQPMGVSLAVQKKYEQVSLDV